jgi:hypothetical protein
VNIGEISQIKNTGHSFALGVARRITRGTNHESLLTLPSKISYIGHCISKKILVLNASDIEALT